MLSHLSPSRIFRLPGVFILTLIGLLAGPTGFSQQRIFTNEQHFGVEEGLPQSYISGILQDEDGFIWLSTLDGFCRYDGRQFKTFRYNAEDSSGLAINTLNGLGKLANNIVTIYYSPTQAAEFNLRTFKTTPNNIRDRLAEIPGIRWQSYRFGYDRSNWFFTVNDHKGVGWINGISGKIHFANTANGMLHTDTVNAITQSAGGRIYLISKNGVQVSDTAQTKFEWVGFETHLENHFTKLNWDVFGEKFSIVSYPPNRVAMLEKDKLTILDIDKKTSTIITLPAPTPGNITGNNGLQTDAAGRVYFEYYGRIYRLTENNELKLLWEYMGAPSRISSFFIDRSDVLWVSLNAQGLLKIDLQALHFESYRYRTNFIEAMAERLSGRQQPLPPDWSTPDAAYYFRQARDTSGNFYSCNSWYSRSAVYQFTAQGFMAFKHVPERKIFTALFTGPRKEIWAFEQSESAWYIWKTPRDIPRKLEPDPINYIGVEVADAVYAGGAAWISTYSHGLFRFDLKNTVTKYVGQQGSKKVPQTLTEICPDPVDKNRIWIGSRGGGLLLWDVDKGLQRIYTTRDGLPNNTIYCILPDKRGRIWCSTNKGIFRLDPATGHVITFEKTDGLQGNEFNRAHKFILPDGRLVFGGLEGYTIFNPENFNITGKKGDVPVLLTGLQINNEEQDINVEGSLIHESLSTLSVIKLPFDKNYLRFEFAALLYNQPQKIKYRFQMAGADKSWVENNYSNVAAYSSLAPGKYIFRMNATDNNGIWSDTITEIKVVIYPPFWATWWARGIYVILAFLLVRGYFVFREKRLQIQQNLAFGKREAIRLREMDEMKDRFFSNITHEFRTPLTLIMTPLEKLLQDRSLSEPGIKNVQSAQRNSRHLLRLINEFLDFSKLNNGQLILTETAGEIELFTKNCVSSFEEAANEKNIALRFSGQDVAGYYLFDQDKWEKIVSNLVSNSLKFTPGNGSVSVLLSSTKQGTELRVSDTGPGIPVHLQQKIFTRFFQVDDSSVRTNSGTGIGLSLVKELTELMHGTVRLESEPGQKTSFVVTVPMKKILPEPIMPLESSVRVKKSPVTTEGPDVPVILLAEDNDELRSFLADSLRKKYRVLEAKDGMIAWNLILQELPDIVISDVMMPGKDGFDLCLTTKTDYRSAHIGFILLTSKAAHDARLKGLATGADDYITKPFSLPELELRTANLIQLQQKQRTWLQSQINHPDPRNPLPGITDPFLVKLYEEIDAKLEDADLGVDYLCKAMAMSRSTLNRKLRSILNISTNDFIRQYRLQKAATLIMSGMDISSAAYSTGFSSPSYFSHCFKEQYGTTPSDWILKHN